MPAMLQPLRRVAAKSRILLSLGWAATCVLLTSLASEKMPSLAQVLEALRRLWWEQALGRELGQTLLLTGHAMVVSVCVALALAYGSLIPLLRAPAKAMCKLRFLGVQGLVPPLLLMTGGGYGLKVWLLSAGMVPFLTDAVVEIVESVPKDRVDYLRVLGLSDWAILREVFVVGTLNQVLGAVRQNLAMGWAMISMVEGISRAGGVGAMLANQEKHWEMAEMYAVLLTILVVGIALDWFMGTLIDAVCPHAALEQVGR